MLEFYRLGGGSKDANDVMRHPFFAPINWDDLYKRKVSITYSLIYSLYRDTLKVLFLLF